MRGEKRDAKVAGRLTRHDDAGLTIETTAGVRELTWDQVTPSSGFSLRARLIDKTKAADWLDLGRWAWDRGIEQSARTAFQQATRLDGSLASRVSAIVASPAGGKLPVTVAAVPTTPMPEKPVQPERVARGGRPIIHYEKPTPEEATAAIARVRAQKTEVETKLKVKLAEVETDHFVIFTDWQPSEFGFLKEQCEGAYRVVAKQFDRSPKDSVFVGKLPVYMFATQPAFRGFAKQIDDEEVAENVLGYFRSIGTMGHLAMWKPSIGTGIGAGGTLEAAKRNWGRTLVHEFCHAFIHRYRSDVFIPRWLNEGTAELISEGVLPTNNYYERPRTAAQQGLDVSVVFEDGFMPTTGDAYPVMMTIVESLVRRDRAAFLQFFNDLKDGDETEEALRKRFHLDFAGLAEAWKSYARVLR